MMYVVDSLHLRDQRSRRAVVPAIQKLCPAHGKESNTGPQGGTLISWTSFLICNRLQARGLYSILPQGIEFNRF